MEEETPLEQVMVEIVIQVVLLYQEDLLELADLVEVHMAVAPLVEDHALVVVHLVAQAEAVPVEAEVVLAVTDKF